MSDVRPETIEAVWQLVLRDLKPSRRVVYCKITLSLASGAILTLALCAQFGVAMSPIALLLPGHLMEAGGPIVCALVCGFVFAFVPVLMMRLLCSALQFRAIARHDGKTCSLGLAIAGGAIAFYSYGVSSLEYFAWLIAAWLGFKLICFVIAKADKLISFLTSTREFL